MCEIVGTFVVVRDCLFAVKWGEEESDCLAVLFSNWQDPEFLEEFFETHKSDLQSGFFGEISVEDAVLNTIEAAGALERDLLRIAANSLLNDISTSLNDLFKPLSPADCSIYRLKSKAYGGRGKSWLRLYAIRLGMNCYVITGGAIKLTKKMQDRIHTTLELGKLEAYCRYLKSNGIDTETDFSCLMDVEDDD